MAVLLRFKFAKVLTSLGKEKQAAVCFDTELMRWSAAWTGDFLKIYPAREEPIPGVRIAAPVEHIPVEAHEKADLVRRPLPVLGGERVRRQPLHADLDRSFDDVEQ